MVQFLQENIAAFTSMLVMAVFWFVLSFRSVKDNINSIDKKMADKGMESMTENEKQIIRNVMRSSIINDSIGAFIGGIVALIVGYFAISVF